MLCAFFYRMALLWLIERWNSCPCRASAKVYSNAAVNILTLL